MPDFDALQTVIDIRRVSIKMRDEAAQMIHPDRRAETWILADKLFSLAGDLDRIRLGWNAKDAEHLEYK